MAAVSAPPAKDRIAALDGIRGVAILGILLANIAGLAGPAYALDVSGTVTDASRSWHEALIIALVAGKFRGMLAILFGIGLMLQFQSRKAAGGPWPGSYLRRSLLLALIGLVHGLLLWYGDILLAYGVTALIMMWFAWSSDKVLRWVVLIGLIFGFLFGMNALGIAIRGESAGGAASWFREALPGSPYLNIWITPAGETEAYRHGGYGIQTLHRVGVVALAFINDLILLPYYGALFAGGMLIARSRVWEDRERLERALRRGMMYGLGIGLPLNLATIPLTLAGKGFGTSEAVEVCFGAILAVGYLSLLGWLFVRFPSLLRLFAPVGRTALSCYLLTSVIATTIYYSWGLGLFGRSTEAQDWMVVVGIWGVLLGFAAWWTRWFEYGPVEWVWRSAVEKRRLPWRRAR
jgi:uncharacterized protein